MVVSHLGIGAEVLFQPLPVIGQGRFHVVQAGLELPLDEERPHLVGLRVLRWKPAVPPAPQLTEEDAEIGHVAAEFAGVGEFLGTPAQALDDAPVPMGAQQAAPGQYEHTQEQKSQAYQELDANGPS